MKTIRTKVYQFSELSESAKQTVIEKLYDINYNHDWWNFIYDDAKEIGLKLDSFDIDRNKHATGQFIHTAYDCANKIKENHGETCDTYKTAVNFIKEYDNLVEKYSDGKKKDIVADGNEYEFDTEAEELDETFLNDLLIDYADMLQKESEYLSSKEAIIETIEANEYDFTKDGKLFHS